MLCNSINKTVIINIYCFTLTTERRHSTLCDILQEFLDEYMRLRDCIVSIVTWQTEIEIVYKKIITKLKQLESSTEKN